MRTPVHALKSTSNRSFDKFAMFQTPDSYWDLLRSIFVTLLKKLSSAIVLFCFFQRQFLQLCFKYASEQIIVKIRGSKYQKLIKTLSRKIFQDMYCLAHKNATLKSPIQRTVPPLPLPNLLLRSAGPVFVSVLY